ncbi:DUF6934 family protein [Pedobacter metabolipauper]|uniref:Uncharacterized protein n=1 Tax=Pedobacter metabolipauper TaxID=425513 RepID=A0A4R6SYE9_9SPHI|nr:hypothetical protein [Pedobacter metabolipauper]TDQ11052.1 hypothetical protein ATK78_0166 [Pedobacter metabolipauper]
MALLSSYEYKESDKSEKGIKYFFISKGKKDVVKAVHYMYNSNIYQQKIYNLGFGDYQLDIDEIDDKVNTNNVDIYKVFNTVLSTVPIFFKAFPGSIIIVQGSDSNPDFHKTCKSTCRKRCEDICKNQNRRIKSYTRYVNKNYDELTKDYAFFGGVKTIKSVIIEDFIKENTIRYGTFN